MSNQSELDELRSYSSEAVAEAEVRKPPITEFIGTVTSISIAGSGFEGRRQLNFHNEDIEIISANPPTSATETDIKVNLPAKVGDKPRASSPLGGIILAAQKNGIGEDVTAFQDKRIHWKGHARSLGGDMSPFWQWEPELHDNNSLVGGSGGAAQQQAEPTLEGLAAAYQLLEGKTEIQFQSAALRSKDVQADKALLAQISSGQFTKGLLESGAAEETDGVFKLITT